MAQKKWPSGTPGIYKLENKPNSKCRFWRLVVTITKVVNGKKTSSQVAENFEGTFTEAVKARHKLKGRSQEKTVVDKSDVIFDEYSEVFLKARKDSGEVAPDTLKCEKYKLKALGYLIGDVKLQVISVETLNSVLNDLHSGHSRSGKRLSGTFLNDVIRKVSLLMDYAVKEGVIEANPCDAVSISKKDTKKKQSMKRANLNELLDKLNPAEPMELGAILCATLGLRRGEAVGLPWGDVNFYDRTVHIQHSYDDAGNLNGPKTQAGDRFLPLSIYVYEALKKRETAALSFCELYAPDLLVKVKGSKKLKDDVPIMCDRFGNRFHPAGFGHWWNNHRTLLGADGWTLHELRHTFLTLAAQKGVHPSVMQQLAGHSTSQVTMEIYTHVNYG